MKPLCIDLFCGLGGWTEGFLAEGYRVIGFDIEVRPYPAQLVIQDVLTIHGSQFKDAAVIVASPPCQNYSYLAMPWSRSTNPENSKAAKALRLKWETEGPDNRLFDACFRIQREAIEATKTACMACSGVRFYQGAERCGRCLGLGYVTRYIPLIVENVRGAQPWVGRSAWNYGSFHLWGDVPALMPINLRGGKKRNPDGTSHPSGSWFAIADSSQGDRREGQKGNGGMWFGPVAQRGDPRAAELNPDGTRTMPDGTKIGGDWFSDPKSTCRKHGSRSSARKAASAQIAKIPLPLASWIAQVYRPRTEAVA